MLINKSLDPYQCVSTDPLCYMCMVCYHTAFNKEKHPEKLQNVLYNKYIIMHECFNDAIHVYSLT